MRSFVEVKVPAIADSDELAGFLSESGLAGSWEADGVAHLFWDRKDWTESLEDEIRRVLSLLACAELPALEIEEVPDQDWNARWASSVQPVLIGGRVLVRQSWNSAAVPPNGTVLVLDPKRAFGTGYHATTQLLVEWLLESVSGGERLLDVGTGSGLLAMVALRLGAARALGIDLDPEAIECAGEYAAANGFGAELALRVASVSDPLEERFDLVTANLDRQTLLRHGAHLVARLADGGRLAVTGIQPDDVDDVTSVLKAAGALPLRRRERDEWVALTLGRL